jgi:hypothetical protein
MLYIARYSYVGVLWRNNFEVLVVKSGSTTCSAAFTSVFYLKLVAVLKLLVVGHVNHSYRQRDGFTQSLAQFGRKIHEKALDFLTVQSN